MKKNIGLIIGVLAVAATLISPPFHGYLLFLFMNGLVLINAVILYSNLGPPGRYLDDMLGVFVIALAQITVTMLYPGLLGLLSLVQVVFTQIGCLGLTYAAVRLGWLRLPAWKACMTRGRQAVQEAVNVCSEHSAGLVACVFTGFAFVFVFAVSALNPPIGIDSIFFHLMQAVYWLQNGFIPVRLLETYAYPHSNPLVYLWGLYPFHHDFLARFTQTPFILAGALAGYGICRTLEMARPLSLITACAVLTMPAYLANGIALTDPDTQMAGTMLISLYFALSLARSYRLNTVIFLALSLGHLLGAKYNSVYYGVPLVILTVYAWGIGVKNKRPARIMPFISHGLLLSFIPIAIGGIAYIYRLYSVNSLVPFGDHLTAPDYVASFNIWRFFTSEESLKHIGLTGLFCPVIGFGLLKCILQEDRRRWMLPVFTLLPLCFSLAVYMRFGYYEDAQAIRHLLATLALCIILGGWGLEQVGKARQSLIIWGLVSFIILNAVLGIWRQWFIHRLHTDVLSLFAAVLTGLIIWCLLHDRPKTGTWLIRFRQSVAWRPALLIIFCAGLWGLYGWEWAYRDMKYARWAPKFGFGTAWGFIGEGTKEREARIAYNVAPYPILGYDLKNVLLPMMPNISSVQSPLARQAEFEMWESDLQNQNIDMVYLLAIGRNATSAIDNVEWHFDTVTAWMKQRSDHFRPVFTGGRESVFEVLKQTE